MSSATGQLICTQCKSDYSGPKRPMLRCSSCKKGWHTYCHSPVVTVGQYKAMYEAEMNRKAHRGAVRFSTWRCSLCSSLPSSDQCILVISSDEEENKPQPRRSVKPSKSVSPALATSTEDVIDLTEGFAGQSSWKGEARVRDTSQSRSRSKTLDLPRREEHHPPTTGIGLQHRGQPSVTPPPSSATLSEPTIIIDGEDDDLEMGVDASRHDETPRPVLTQSLSPELPRRTETRLLPQIIKEEMQELVIPPPAEPEKPRKPRKPKETKRFIPTSRKGRLRIRSFANFYMPFGPETIPKVDLGTLEEALRKLGLDSGSG